MSPFQQFTKVKHEFKHVNRYQSLLKLEVLNIAVIVLILVMGTMYLVQVNRATTKGYQIRDLEKRINLIEESNQKAQLEIAELQSLDSIEERMETLGMVPVDRMQYVKVPGTSVAVR
jgi:cell division protein FtsL